MIESQEIIERSIYMALLKVLVSGGFTVNPENYDGEFDASLDQYREDVANIIANKKYYITLLGVGNNQAKGEKTVPRIVINSRGFLPGDIGLERQVLVKDQGRYFVSEFPFESINQYIDIHLVANTQESLRMMTYMLQLAIPTRGYIKPYIYKDVPFDGNIYIELANFYDSPTLDKGVMEKIYQFEIKDTLLTGQCTFESLPPIKDITMFLDLMDDEEPNELIRVKS